MTTQYPHVFQSLRVGGMVVLNRIVRTAHTTHQPLVGGGSNHTDYQVARARGGVGLSISGASSVHASAPMAITSHLDGVVPEYEALAEALAPYPMKVMQQLWHGGSAGHENPLGGPRWSASDVPNPVRGATPVPMTQTMIDEVVAGFAAAAGRVQRGGLSGVQIHAGHHYLVGQFLSPVTNHRTDDYGGSPENRLRFLRQILAAVRAEVGDGFPVGVRIAGDEDVPGGLDPTGAGAVALAVQEAVDFVDVSFGGYYRFNRMMATGDGYPLGYELESSTVVTRDLAVPTIVTGRIMTVEHAERIIAAGDADMVSMVRALIADPDLVAKTLTGQEDRIRPCIGTNEGRGARAVAGIRGAPAGGAGAVGHAAGTGHRRRAGPGRRRGRGRLGAPHGRVLPGPSPAAVHPGPATVALHLLGCVRLRRHLGPVRRGGGHRRRRQHLPADAVVMVGVNRSASEVAEALAESYDGEPHVIGDALVPGRLRDAVTQGATVGRAL